MLTKPSTTPLVPLASPPGTSMLYTSSTCTCVQQCDRPQQRRRYLCARDSVPSAWAEGKDKRLMTAGLHLLWGAAVTAAGS